MLFHTFNTQEERRNYGGSAFIEIQFCNMPAQSTTKELVSVEYVQNWKNDSLYVYIDDDNSFCQEYSRIFDCCTYNNLKTGPVDIYGINYCAPSLIESIVERLQQERPLDWEVLHEWLMKSKAYNGFYILGY